MVIQWKFLFFCLNLQSSKKKKKQENNYFLYDKKINTSAYIHTCMAQPLERLDVYTRIGTHLCVCMYIYWRCCFV